MKTKFKPAPGILIAQEIEDSKDSSFKITDKIESRLVTAKVVAMGINIITDFGALLEADRYAKVGDIIYFLSYEGNYDNTVIDGVKYYMVKWQDLRTVITHEKK